MARGEAEDSHMVATCGIVVNLDDKGVGEPARLRPGSFSAAMRLDDAYHAHYLRLGCNRGFVNGNDRRRGQSRKSK